MQSVFFVLRVLLDIIFHYVSMLALYISANSSTLTLYASFMPYQHFYNVQYRYT